MKTIALLMLAFSTLLLAGCCSLCDMGECDYGCRVAQSTSTTQYLPVSNTRTETEWRSRKAGGTNSCNTCNTCNSCTTKRVCNTCKDPQPYADRAAVEIPRVTMRTVQRTRKIPVTKTAYRTVKECKTVQEPCTKQVRTCDACTGCATMRTVNCTCERRVSVDRKVPYTYTVYRDESYTE